MRTSFRAMITVSVALIASDRCLASTITLGQAANYALFAGPDVNTFSFNGPSSITGNVAIGANGKYNFSSPATITGTMYTDTGVSGSNSGVTISGGVVTNFNLSQAVSDAHTAATNAAGLAATGTVPGNTIVVTNPTQDVTFTGSAGQNVLKVTDINLNNGTFTINGTASEKFIIDVSGKFIVNGSASILLSGGVTANDVLFDIEGTGQDVSITGNTNSVVNGTILAVSRNISLHDQTLNGAVIGAFGPTTSFQIQDTSGFTLNYEPYQPLTSTPPAPEPSSLLLAGSALLWLGASASRRGDSGVRGTKLPSPRSPAQKPL